MTTPPPAKRARWALQAIIIGALAGLLVGFQVEPRMASADPAAQAGIKQYILLNWKNRAGLSDSRIDRIRHDYPDWSIEMDEMANRIRIVWPIGGAGIAFVALAGMFSMRNKK